MSARLKSGLVGIAVAVFIAAPAGPAGASDAPYPPQASDCVVRVQGVQGTTQVCQGTFVDDNDGDGQPDPGGNGHTYACAGVEGRAACAWTVSGSAVPVSVGLCAYGYNEANPSAPQTNTHCVNDGTCLVTNGGITHPSSCARS